MRIKRNLSLAIGLLASILGLSIAVDTAMADGCCCCCCCCGPPCPMNAASCETMACATGDTIILCSGNLTEANCGKDPNFEVQDFPKSCVSTTDQTKCNEPNENCKRVTNCTWDADMKRCSTLVGTGSWTPQTKPTTVPCT